MEQGETEVPKKLSRYEKVNLDVINKARLIRNDSTSRHFGFSHGYLLLKSTWFTIAGNFLLYGVITSLMVVAIGLNRGTTSKPSIHLFQLDIPHFAVEWALCSAGVGAIDAAAALLEFNWQKRSKLLAAYFFLVAVSPMIFFNWSFMGY